ncbi:MULTISPECIES: phage baseplate protein [Streptomyces]|uniref:Teichoic acid biosynthesis protein C n=1 Tax=Streptomyces siderophoricus TaxID=2802281 RepID=A0ABS1N4B2_9ACTN|nr:teichoic acid biosynthesis protein C [Streptomyces sp. 9-7]MBL1094843.1 teichoic acid biosynthesis protein C [Streptomyces sp. 9-7]
MSTDFSAAGPGRRAVLGWLGGAAVAGAVVPGQRALAAASPPRAAAGRVGAPPDRALPALAAAGRQFLAGRLRHTTVLQSFVFDERRGHVYALQVVAGGVRLAGERAAVPHAVRVRRGDLCLNRLELDGSPAGYMYLKGFGHGGSIGLEESWDGVTLWTEWDANPASGYGRGLCRFRFTDGRVLSRTAADLRTYRPLSGSTSNSPAVDPVHRRLLLRYKRRGVPHFALHDLDRFRAGWYRPLITFAQPGAHLGLPFQGMALHGISAYQLLGSAYGVGNPPSSGGNARLYRIDLRTGRAVWQQIDRTAPELSPREPEGLAVWRGGGAGLPRLCLGFTEGPAGGRGFRLYEKALN